MKVFQNKRYNIYNYKNDSILIEDQQPRSVLIIVNHNNQLAVVRQIRKAINIETIELPGGKIEKSEKPVDAARRELEEETGLLSDNLVQIGTIHPLPSLINREITFFYTEDINGYNEECNQDEDENIIVEYHPFSQVEQNLKMQKWRDTYLSYGIYICKLKGFINLDFEAEK